MADPDETRDTNDFILLTYKTWMEPTKVNKTVLLDETKCDTKMLSV